MRKINLLDCTLRDGGYINNWHFGYHVITSILQKLATSNVEYVECGYFSEKKGDNADYTQYKDFEAFNNVMPSGSKKQRYAMMIDFGQYDIKHVPDAVENAPILRICFRQKDKTAALAYCKQLMQKGYIVFVQPMASLNYTDVEFVELIHEVNEIQPACFYIVDSFGVIEIEDFQRILFLADHNLKEGIMLGYHAHNNLQQAYGNAKYMVEQKLIHDVILDASVYGMGRGAGNLNMELFASYLNNNYDKSYQIDAFLDIMDEYLKPIFIEHYWGYSLPFYLSAQYNCHPNYASYFSDKNTLSNKSMRQLLASLPDDVKSNYSTEQAEKYYQMYQEKYVDDTETLEQIRMHLKGREILILAPGKSISTCRQEITSFIEKHQPVVIAVNVIPTGYHSDYLFCANEKRLQSIGKLQNCQLIVTSNISDVSDAMRVNYASYLSSESDIADNPILMLLHLLNAIGISQISIAGFDGYGAVSEENYYDKSLALGTSISLKMKRNTLIKNEVYKLREQIELHFLTESKYTD